MTNVKIEIYDWVDLHRLCMASRRPSMDSAFSLALIHIEQAKTELEDRCFSMVGDNVRDAIRSLEKVLQAILESEDFAFLELASRKAKENPED
jgi:hypothetical protein